MYFTVRKSTSWSSSGDLPHGQLLSEVYLLNSSPGSCCCLETSTKQLSKNHIVIFFL